MSTPTDENVKNMDSDPTVLSVATLSKIEYELDVGPLTEGPDLIFSLEGKKWNLGHFSMY